MAEAARLSAQAALASIIPYQCFRWPCTTGPRSKSATTRSGERRPKRRRAGLDTDR